MLCSPNRGIPGDQRRDVTDSDAETLMQLNRLLRELAVGLRAVEHQLPRRLIQPNRELERARALLEEIASLLQIPWPPDRGELALGKIH